MKKYKLKYDKDVYKGMDIDIKLLDKEETFYVVEENGFYYAIKDTIEDSDDVEIQEDLLDKDCLGTAVNIDNVITCADSYGRLSCLIQSRFKNKIYGSYSKKLLSLRDGVCYHITDNTKRFGIDAKGLLPSYDSDFRERIDNSIDNLLTENVPIGIRRRNSVFLHPYVPYNYIFINSPYKNCDLYMSKIDLDKTYCAPNNINELFTVDYRGSEHKKIEVYFDHLRSLSKEYWKLSMTARELIDSDKEITDFEVLAYGDNSIIETARVGTFDEYGEYYPLSTENIFQKE